MMKNLPKIKRLIDHVNPCIIITEIDINHNGDMGLHFEKPNPLFRIIRECEEGRDIDALIEGPVCHAWLKRLN